MITINVKTYAVKLDPDTPVMARNQFGNATYGYVRGSLPPNFPVPAIPLIHQWDFSLWVLLETMPPLSEDEWEREEDEWQDFLDNLDNET